MHMKIVLFQNLKDDCEPMDMMSKRRFGIQENIININNNIIKPGENRRYTLLKDIT